MERITTPYRITSLLEDPRKSYKWQTFITDAFLTKHINKEFIGLELNLIVSKLETASSKIDTLWSLESSSKEWKTRKSKLGFSDPEMCQFVYNDDSNDFFPGHRCNNLLALFMYTPQDILSFFQEIPELLEYVPMQDYTYAFFFTKEAVGRFSYIQPWYSMLELSDRAFEACTRETFKKLCGSFRDPIAVVIAPVVHKAATYVSRDLIACHEDSIKQRFLLVTGYAGWSSIFLDKIIGVFLTMYFFNNLYHDSLLESNAAKRGPYIEDWGTLIFINDTSFINELNDPYFMRYNKKRTHFIKSYDKLPACEKKSTYIYIMNQYKAFKTNPNYEPYLIY